MQSNLMPRPLPILAAMAMLGLVGCWSDAEPTSTSPVTRDPVATSGDETASAPPIDLAAELAGRPEARVQRSDGQITQLDLRAYDDIDDRWLEAIATSAPGLRNLKVEGPGITDAAMPALVRLENLAALALQRTSVTDDGVAQLIPLKNLKELSLFGSPVTNAVFTPLAQLPRLQKLQLRQTKIGGQPIGDLSRLQGVVDLELAETDLGNEAMPAIAQLPRLQRLNLWLTKIDDSGLAALPAGSDLRLLNLDNVAGITDASMPRIGSFGKLELLHLGGTSITDAQLTELYKLKQLKTLFLTRTGVTPEGIEALQQAMPWIEKLETPTDSASQK